MKSFLVYITEAVLLENKAWHQFIAQHGDAILDKLGQLAAYNENTYPGARTPESKTNVISYHLGLGDLTAEEGRWVLKHFHGGGIQREEDVHSTVIPNLKRLRQAKAEGKSDASLAKIQGAAALHAHLAKVYPVSDQSLSHLDPKEYTVHGENEHWTIVEPHTKNAACAVGRGTNWCTASTGQHNMFQHYSEQSPLYALIPKNPAYRGERYQMHVPKTPAGADETNLQFMNERDQPVWANHQRPEQMQVLSDPDRPLPEIKDSEARGAIHGMRDYMHYQGINIDEFGVAKQTHLSKVLSVPTETGTHADRMKSAHLLSALYTHRVPPEDLRNALTRGGQLTVKAAMQHIDDIHQSERKKVVTPEIIDHLMASPDPQIRVYGAKHIWDRERLHKALRDPDVHVAMHAIPHFGQRRHVMTPEHVETALQHPHHQVQASAIKWALDSMEHSEDRTKWSARSKQRMDIDNLLTKAITTGSEELRKILAQQHLDALSDEHVFQILQHSQPEHTIEREVWAPSGELKTVQDKKHGIITQLRHINFNRYGNDPLRRFAKRVTPEMMQRAQKLDPERFKKADQINRDLLFARSTQK